MLPWWRRLVLTKVQNRHCQIKKNRHFLQGILNLKIPPEVPNFYFFPFSILFYFAGFIFFDRIFDQFNFLDWIFGRKSGPLFSGSGSKGKSWPKKCLFFCKAQQKIKKLSKKCFFDCKAQQKIKKWSKKCLFDCKAQQKSKNCQKSAFFIVKRSKKQKNVKKVYPVVFFIRWCFLIQYTQYVPHQKPQPVNH